MRLGVLFFCSRGATLLLWGLCLFFIACTPEAPEEGGKQVFEPVLPLPEGRVSWRAWAQRDSARVLDRPLFLFLYSRRSAWCREMAARCFENPEIAGEIDRGMFPVRVDVDRRPDLAERYGMGGWPSVVFLMPDGAWITGATYMDPVDLVRLLRRVRIYFDNPERLKDLERERGYLEERIAREARPRTTRFPAAPVDDVADSARAALERCETPSAEALIGLLEYGERAGREDVKASAAGLLERLATGPLRDEDGAFFLAALTPDGVIVDREKVLARNAGLLAAFARAAPYSKICGKTAGALGQRLAEAFVKDSLFVAGFDGNGARDEAVYTDWNALAVSGFIALFRASGNRRDLVLARNAFQALQNRLKLPKSGFKHGPGDAPLLLADQALAARAALDLYEVEKNPGDLTLARDLAALMQARFKDGPGALRDRAPEPGRAVAPAVDRLSPSGNGVAAQVFLRLAGHTGEAGYREAAGKILKALPQANRAMQAGALFRGLVLFEKE